MHLSPELLRAYSDRELQTREVAAVKEHLAACPQCARRLEMLQARASATRGRLALLAPDGAEARRSHPSAATSILKHQKEPSSTMMNKRTLLGAAAALILLVIVFSFTPASAWANSFLGLFRVQKVTVVSFDPAAIQKTQGTLSSQRSAIEQIFKQNLVINEKGKGQAVASADEAAKLAGFTPRLLGQDGKLYVKPGMDATLTIDQPRFQALMDAAGVKATLPQSVNGKVVTADVPTSIVASYGDCPAGADPTQAAEGKLQDCTVFMQFPSPTINAPDQLDVPKLGQAVFEFLGLPEAEAASLSNSIDWASTLVLPIPTGEGISYQNVTVDGVSGTLLLATRAESTPHYAVIWTKDGMLYTLTGPGGMTEAEQTLSTLH